MILAKRPRSDVESCCLADQSNCLYTTPFKKRNCFFYQQQNELLLLLCLFWNIGSKIKVRQKMKKKDWSLLQLKFDGRMNWLFLDSTAIYKWGSKEQREDAKIRFWLRGERERSPQLSQIMLPSFPHLGKSQASTPPKCNGGVSTWRNCLADHSILWAR